MKIKSIKCSNDLNFEIILDSQLPNIGYDSNYLTIHRITKDMNKAVFECTAQNEFGFSQTVSITLDVLCKAFMIVCSQIP